jgi:hypothetical protein
MSVQTTSKRERVHFLVRSQLIVDRPIPQTQELFKLLDYPSQLFTEAPTAFDPGVTITVLNAYFNCNNPPLLGCKSHTESGQNKLICAVSFPAQSQLKEGETATVFNVSPDVWGVFNNTATNCTSILGGTNGIDVGDTPAWLLGQSFFSGHYIDFNMDSGSEVISFANLANPADGSAASAGWQGWGSW